MCASLPEEVVNKVVNDLALGAVRSALVAAGVTPGPGVRVQAQKRAEPSDWMEF